MARKAKAKPTKPSAILDWSKLPVVMTTAEAANLLRLAAPRVSAMAKNGEIPSRKLGGVWRFEREALRAWILGGMGEAGYEGKRAEPQRG
ncbi:MAG: helix-turn-helix domain-containing protein [Eubacteriaceae bacterium]|nr:helix-turn-helix domain-containing protein [Eubacteriaceae bacterium]